MRNKPSVLLYMLMIAMAIEATVGHASYANGFRAVLIEKQF